MDIIQLKYFEKTADLESMTLAAAELGISQSYLSKTIAKLEAETGTKLFERVGRRIRLSEQGVIFLNSAKKILAEYNNCTRMIRYHSDTYSGTIAIAVMGATLHPVILQSVAGYAERHKAISFSFTSYQENRLDPEELKEFDFLISRPELMPKDFDGIYLPDNMTYVLMSYRHKLANRSEISLAELADEPLVVSRYVHLDDAETVYSMFRLNNISPKIRVTINDNSSADESIFKHLLITSGKEFVGLIPGAYRCIYRNNPDFVTIPLKQFNKVKDFNTVLSHNASSDLTQTAVEFLKFVQVNAGKYEDSPDR